MVLTDFVQGFDLERRSGLRRGRDGSHETEGGKAEDQGSQGFGNAIHDGVLRRSYRFAVYARLLFYSHDDLDHVALLVEQRVQCLLGLIQREMLRDEALELQPGLMVVDSVQTMYSETVDSSAGSVSQIKEVTAILLHFAKSSGIPVLLIGHITKDGAIAGPKILEHIVDVVLQFEGDDKGAYRLLRSIKNRFGSTSELAVFEMTGTGLRDVTNPSEMLMPMHEQGLSGTAVAVMLDGLRPFVFEVQALVSTAAYGTPQRSATGFDGRRLGMLLAVLEKRAGFKLNMKDVFLNMAGGLRVADPACDLAVVCAVLSSAFDYAIPEDICFAAEVGLSGEVRPVNQCDRRIAEAARLGFKKIFVSKYAAFDKKVTGIQVIKVADIPAVVRALFKG